MKSLKEIAERKIEESSMMNKEETWAMLTDLKDTVNDQRLTIIELEENIGAATQENYWLKEEIEMLKVQVAELEEMIYGETQRYGRERVRINYIHLYTYTHILINSF